jgi:hypothetical protein
MIRRLAVVLVAATMVVVGWAWAQDPPADQPEPPVRLKKKAKPGADKPAPGDDKEPKPARRLEDKPKSDDEADEPQVPQEDEQEVLARVSKNMRASEERLGNKELGDGTRQVQRDIVKDLDELIRQSQSDSPPPQGQQGQGGGAQQPKQGQRQPQAGGAQSERRQRQARRAQRRGQRNRAGQRGNARQQNQPTPSEQASNNPGGGNGGKKGEMNKIPDLYKDIWGHLPETMRAEMDAYAREKFMAKYEELIKRYYDRAARESRSRGD